VAFEDFNGKLKNNFYHLQDFIYIFNFSMVRMYDKNIKLFFKKIKKENNR